MTDARGIAGRDELWGHPDLLPTADDLDDPEGFVRGRPDLDLTDLEGPEPGQEQDAGTDAASAGGEPGGPDDGDGGREPDQGPES